MELEHQQVSGSGRLFLPVTCYGNLTNRTNYHGQWLLVVSALLITCITYICTPRVKQTSWGW